MNKQTILVALIVLGLVLSGCAPRPTGVTGRVLFHGNVSASDLQIRLIELQPPSGSGPVKVFVEGQAVATAELDKDGSFKIQVRPGDYVIKVIASATDQVLTGHRVTVRRNRLTRIEIEIE